jgi:PhnB protein
MTAELAKPAHTVTAYFIVKNASAALDFYARAFGADEVVRLTDPAGRIGHAEIRIGDSLMMLADEHPDFGALSPPTIGGSPVKFHIQVEDADAAVERALAAGATLLRPLENQFYGMRSGMIADPFGHAWFIAAPLEQVSVVEMQRRYERTFEAEKA